MRKDVTWFPGQANNGIWKQDVLKYLGGLLNLRVLVETGTCDGGTLGGVYQAFRECHSIELAEYYYNISKIRFSGAPNIFLYQGNSATKLRELLINTIPNEPSLFWLDAHTSGGLTADEGDPLPQELMTIFELRPDALIVVDDKPDIISEKIIREWNAPEYLQLLPYFKSEWRQDYRCGSLIIQRGGYMIPPFED